MVFPESSIGQGVLFVVVASFFFLPLFWILVAILSMALIEDEKKKKLAFGAILTMTILSFVFFKQGNFKWMWLSSVSCSLFSAFLLFWWLIKRKNVALKVFVGVLFLILVAFLFYPLNPLNSYRKIFNASKLISINNPCQKCQKENWECSEKNCPKEKGHYCLEGACQDLMNIKNCYCCECIKNYKFCFECFFFWKTIGRCNPETNKCYLYFDWKEEGKE